MKKKLFYKTYKKWEILHLGLFLGQFYLALSPFCVIFAENIVSRVG